MINSMRERATRVFLARQTGYLTISLVRRGFGTRVAAVIVFLRSSSKPRKCDKKTISVDWHDRISFPAE